ncbi:alpha-L-fucosidase [Salibacterium halotolerans]|uniref:Beta-galactosidase trimerisation domain-containing protein n=1 Tax=Salibacterium halotolerans TaxID=1884432 RepID=A0A1I5RT37_9BACI|nr:alpha-L-fucosidase [Salibacterium halotolerans]SFP61694.1 Beta-galactosidase trimerisation domain-containing protein [Salibacterium halotolerans]
MGLPFRQVHLDFHTSPHIPDVGRDFNPEAFAEVLKDSFVDSVTVFAKCHHGYSYYPTRIGTKHPSLRRDMLGEMIDACHARGIRVPVYTTVVWDELAAGNNAWRQVDRDGKLVGQTPLGSEDNRDAAGWKWLCMNSPYVDYLESHTKEFVRDYNLDGVFFDIVHQTRPGCVCPHCLEQMEKLGLEPEDTEDLLRHSLITERKTMERLEQIVHGVKPELPVFFNGRVRLDRNAEAGIRPEMSWMTHVDIESLPGGLWGYNHFPLYAAFYKTLDCPFTGMTGRFHTMWGDFGSLKNQAALEYECFLMMAHGAGCAVGDQLHPRGALDKETYRLIADVYQQAVEKEEWCRDVRPVDEIGVLISQVSEGVANEPSSFSDEGAMRMLTELQRPFCLLDEASDFSRVRLIIAPDHVPFSDTLLEKINAFIKQGGKLLLSHRSGLNEAGEWEVPAGLQYKGKLPYSPDYVNAADAFESLSDTAQVFYERGSRVDVSPGADVLAYVQRPFFNRTRTTYMSHFHTPVDEVTDDPAVVREGGVMYLAHPVFESYRRHGSLAYKQLASQCIDALLPEPVLETDLPSTAQITINDQPDKKRRMLHVLHYIHQRRAEGLDVLEDVIPLYGITVSHRVDETPREVYLAPSEEKLSFSYDRGAVSVTIPEVRGHQIVVFQF